MFGSILVVIVDSIYSTTKIFVGNSTLKDITIKKIVHLKYHTKMSSAKIVNLDPPREDDCREDEWFMPKWPMRELVIGGSGEGKTNAVLNPIVFDWVDIDTLVVCAADIEEEKYEFLKEWAEAKQEDRQTDIENYHRMMKNVKEENRPHEPLPFEFLFIDNIHDLPDIKLWDKPVAELEYKPPITLSKNRRTLVLIDDMINEKYQGNVSDIFIRGRKKNIGVIYLAHSFFAVPEMMRKQTKQYMLFGGLTKKNIQGIADGISIGLEWKDFNEYYQEGTKQESVEDHPFMYIDLAAPKFPEDTRIRKGFDTIMYI